jgi:hypothetical protein
MNLLQRLFRRQKTDTTECSKGSKDPSDYKKDDLSTEWHSENHYCTKCLKTTGHNEFMADICNGCGSFNTQERYQRVYRKIFIDGKWKYQVRYIDGKEEIIEKWY